MTMSRSLVRGPGGWILVAFAAVMAVAADGAEPRQSPHAEALALVLTCDADSIAALEVEGDGAWHDTKVRHWAVKRPFSPGDMDSTHWFVVSYSIDHHEVATWNAFTDRHEVKRITTSPKGEVTSGPTRKCSGRSTARMELRR